MTRRTRQSQTSLIKEEEPDQDNQDKDTSPENPLLENLQQPQKNSKKGSKITKKIKKSPKKKSPTITQKKSKKTKKGPENKPDQEPFFQKISQSFVLPKCMVCYDSDCIFRCLTLQTSIYVCSKNVHDNFYICTEVAKNCQNKCPMCREQNILAIDPVHRKQLQDLNETSLRNQTQIYIIQECEKFFKEQQAYIKQRPQELLSTYNSFKLSPQKMTDFDAKVFETVIFYLKQQLTNVYRKKSDIPITCFSQILAEFIEQIFNSEELSNNLFPNDNDIMQDPKAQLTEIKKQLNEFVTGITKLGFRMIEMKRDFSKNYYIFMDIFRVWKCLFQKFDEQSNFNSIFQFIETLYSDNKRLKAITMVYLYDCFFRENTQEQKLMELTKKYKLNLKNEEKINQKYEALYTQTLEKILEKQKFLFDHLGPKEITPETKNILKLSIDKGKKKSNTNMPQGVYIFLIIIEDIMKYCQKNKNHLKIFDKQFKEILCSEINQMIIIVSFSFNTLKTDCAFYIANFFFQTVNRLQYFNPGNFNFRKALLEMTRSSDIKSKEFAEFLIKIYGKKIQKSTEMQQIRNFLKTIITFFQKLRSRSKNLRLEENYLKQLFELLKQIYLRLKNTKLPQNNERNQAKLRIYFGMIFKQLISGAGPVLCNKGFVDFIYNGIVKESMGSYNSLQQQKFLKGVLDSINIINYHNQHSNSDDEEEEEDPNYTSRSYQDSDSNISERQNNISNMNNLMNEDNQGLVFHSHYSYSSDTVSSSSSDDMEQENSISYSSSILRVQQNDHEDDQLDDDWTSMHSYSDHLNGQIDEDEDDDEDNSDISIRIEQLTEDENNIEMNQEGNELFNADEDEDSQPLSFESSGLPEQHDYIEEENYEDDDDDVEDVYDMEDLDDDYYM